MVALQAADAQQWLKAACRIATKGLMASSAADFACAREQAFPLTEENGFRHLRTSDFSDSVAALPPEELQVLLPIPGHRFCVKTGLNACQHFCRTHSIFIPGGTSPLIPNQGQPVCSREDC